MVRLDTVWTEVDTRKVNHGRLGQLQKFVCPSMSVSIVVDACANNCACTYIEQNKTMLQCIHCCVNVGKTLENEGSRVFHYNTVHRNFFKEDKVEVSRNQGDKLDANLLSDLGWPFQEGVRI